MSNFKGGDDVAPPHELTFGLHWSHLDFVQQAVNKGHPSSSIGTLPQFVKDTLFEVARGDQESFLKHRNDFFRTWLAEAKALEKDEADLKATLR